MYWAATKCKECPALFWLHHIPNGGQRDKREAYMMSQQGVRKGVADLFLPSPRQGKHGLYIELKTDSGVQSPEQKKFQAHVESEGYQYELCRSWEAGKEVLIQYLGLTS
jgi:hypothetical protein